MTESWLMVTPLDPLFVPPVEKQQAALDLAKRLRPRATEFELSTSETPRAHFCATSHAISCPFCGEDAEDYWVEELERWWAGDHRDLTMTTRCCRRQTSLNELVYEPAMRPFVCFVLKILSCDPEFEPDEKAQFETALGAPVSTYWMFV